MLSIIINILPFPFYSRINPEVEEESDQGVEGDKKKSRRKKKDLEDDDDDLSDFGSEDDYDEDDDDEDSDSRPKKTLNKPTVLPDISGATIKDWIDELVSLYHPLYYPWYAPRS